MSKHRSGQGTVGVVIGLVVAAGLAWWATSLWMENARLREQNAGGAPRTATAPAPAAAPAAPAAAPVDGRKLDPSARAAMIDKLKSGEGGEKKAWIQMQAGDRESAAFAEDLMSAFKEAGWTVQSSTVSGMMIKPGLYFFEAEEESPESVNTVRDALEAAGLTLTTHARGYRSYAEEKRRENPKWAGISLEPSQTFVFVIGPKAKSEAPS